MNGFFKKSSKLGFTLVETLVGVAVFMVVATASYQAYVSLFTLINQNQYKILALNLANEQFELIRNLAYSDVGVIGGIPNGKIPNVQTLNRGGIDFIVTTTIRNVDLPFDGVIGGSPNDLSPADNKLAEVLVECPNCKNFTPLTLTTRVAPKALETSSSNGALFIKVFDANGIALPDATVIVENNTVNPPIVVADVTDNNGFLQIIDAPPGIEAYEITVTKEGYSTEKTHQTDPATNPNPSKPHATVVIQQVTQVSFSIDKVSSLEILSVTPTCVAVGGVDFVISGSKEIGQSIPKFYLNAATDSSGVHSSNEMEWDTYDIKMIDATYDLQGMIPLNPLTMVPNNSHELSLIVAPRDPKSLMITVKDSVTQLPLTDVNVTIMDSSHNSTTLITDRGFITHTDWSGGPGVDYEADDGNIDTQNPEGEIKLKDIFGSHASTGVLESSTIDTGSISNFHSLIWSPSDQPVEAGVDSVKFQIATVATTSEPWVYLGPDGTSSTYYTVSNSTISPVHNGDRYIRYKLFMNTASSAVTPNISDISFTVTSSCTPPGQVVFSGLSSGDYMVSVSKPGYVTTEFNVNVFSDWQNYDVVLTQ